MTYQYIDDIFVVCSSKVLHFKIFFCSGMRSKWDINWQVVRGNDQLWPSNCAKDIAFSFLNNFDDGDEDGGDGDG